MNLGILTLDLVLERCIPYPPSIVTFEDTGGATFMATCDLVQQDIHHLPDITNWDDYVANIVGLFVESHISNLGDNIHDIHLLFDEVDSSLVVVEEPLDPPVHSPHDHSS